MECKVCKLSWEDSYAVLFRKDGSGWEYAAKYLDKSAAYELMNSIIPQNENIMQWVK